MRTSYVRRLFLGGSALVTMLMTAAPAFSMSVPGYSGYVDAEVLSGFKEKNGGAVNASGSEAASTFRST